jgi:hypothetical protein
MMVKVAQKAKAVRREFVVFLIFKLNVSVMVVPGVQGAQLLTDKLAPTTSRSPAVQLVFTSGGTCANDAIE